MSENPQALQRLSGSQRVAGLMVALGPELSGKVLAHFPEHEVERISWEIINLKPLAPEMYEALLEEAYGSVAVLERGPQGGLGQALEMLEHALGADRAREMGERMRASIRELPFAFVLDLDPGQLATFLATEHPQTAALVLSYIRPDRAAAIMTQLPVEMRAEVTIRIARMERTSPEVVHEVETQMARKLASSLALKRTTSQTGGLAAVVSLLKSTDLSTENSILEALNRVDPELALAIKERMFVFTNITQLDDRSIQRVLRDVDQKDLGLALKGASDDIRETILRNMSTRAAAMLREDLETMGAVRLSAIEAAQGNIVNVIRRLDEAEEIIIARGEVVG